MLKKIIILMIALVCLLSVSATLAADTNNNEAIAVADAGTFQELQDKISGASGILELDKNYTNTDNYSQAGIAINEDITIDGKGHTIDAQGKSRVFKIDFGVSVTLKNIIFINGNSTSNDDGGAIYSEGVLNVENCLFKNTISKYNGGAIYGYGSKVTVINSTFINTKSTFGGAIYTFIKVDVTNSTFINTTSSFGGAIYNWRNKCTVTNSTFNNTTSSIAGGAIYSEGGVIVKDSNFNNNSANINGASIYTTGVLDVKDSTFNSPNANGMAIIYITSTNAEAIITNNTITSNLLAIYNDGSIIVSPTSLKFDNNIVEIGENATLTATLTDDNGNIIGSQTNVEGEVNGTNLIFVFDKKTNKFTTVYNQTTVKGKYNIAGNYSKATNCDVINGTLYVGQIAELTAPSIVKYYKNGTQFIVKVTENDSPVAGAKIAITISGITYNRTSDENGEAKLNINLAPGEYAVNVYAIGSFGELTTNSTVTVLSTIEANDTVLYYRNGTKYNALFLDSQGNPLNNTEVTFNINGVTYTRITNENGTTSGLNINLNPGEYIITAINTANGEMHSNNITVLPTIITDNLVKYYKNGSQFVVKVLDKQGQASAGQTVKFNINGVIYTKITDDNGEAKLNINLEAGNNAPKIYQITTECNDCTVSNSIIVLPVIIGTDVELQYTSGKKYNIYVFDGQGELEEGVPITFNINGVNYHRTSNSEGTTTGLTINLQPGEYIIIAIRDDNGATISNNVVVNP